MERLKPCPFCGGKVEISEVQDSYSSRKVIAKCNICGITFVHNQSFIIADNSEYYPESVPYRVPESEPFLDAWNRRVNG